MNKAIVDFKEKYKDRREVEHVVDYLNAVFPYKKRFNFSYEQALEKANMWAEKLNKKNEKNLREGNVELILELGDGFKLVRLADQDSKNWEGFHMGHCVASYTNHEGIYSVRDKENIPKCTIEIGEDRITQIKGKGNGSVSPSYIKYVLKSLKHFNYKIRCHELENLGYRPLKKTMKDSFTNLKIISFNNQEFFYTKSKLKLSQNPVFTQAIFQVICETIQSLEYIQKALSNKDIDPSYYDNYAIRYASRNGHHRVVELLLKDERIDPAYYNNEAILSASFNNHYKVVELLLKDERVSPSHRNNEAIRNASKRGNYKVVELLLKDKRVDPSVIDNYAIRHARFNGHDKVVELLLKYERVNVDRLVLTSANVNVLKVYNN